MSKRVSWDSARYICLISVRATTIQSRGFLELKLYHHLNSFFYKLCAVLHCIATKTGFIKMCTKLHCNENSDNFIKMCTSHIASMTVLLLLV